MSADAKASYRKPSIEDLGRVSDVTRVGYSTPKVDPNDAKQGSNPVPQAQ